MVDNERRRTLRTQEEQADVDHAKAILQDEYPEIDSEPVAYRILRGISNELNVTLLAVANLISMTGSGNIYRTEIEKLLSGRRKTEPSS